MLIIGIDPDAAAHGVAVYQDGKLIALKNLPLPELRDFLIDHGGEKMVAIENVMAQNFVYTRNAQASKAAHAKVALSVGRCQQAQAELMRELDYQDIPYVLYRPVGTNWAARADVMKAATGWEGKSNADNRSAAYFGWKLVNDQKLTARIAK